MKNSNRTSLSVMRNLKKAKSLPLKERVSITTSIYKSIYRDESDIHRREYDRFDVCSGLVSIVGSNTKKNVTMFGSNDYLGLSFNPLVRAKAVEAIEKYGVSCCGSPVMNGLSSLHTKLEQGLAKLKGKESAVLMPSGYAANLGWVRSLVCKDDFVVYDQFSHSSFQDAIQHLPTQNRKSFAHNSTDDLESKLKSIRQMQSTETTIFVFVEGLYSMHGDIPPLPRIVELCKSYGAFLVVDDAHGTGTLGKNGFGIFEHFSLKNTSLVTVGTLSKAIGSVGGFIACSEEIAMLIRSSSSPHIFSASLPPSTIAAALTSVEIILSCKAGVDNLRKNIATAQNLLVSDKSSAFLSPIIPIQIPAQLNVGRVVTVLAEDGFFVNGVSFPAVPLSEQCIRVNICSKHKYNEILGLANCIKKIL